MSSLYVCMYVCMGQVETFVKFDGWYINYHRIELPAYIKLPAVYVPTYHKHGYNSQPIPKGSNILIMYQLYICFWKIDLVGSVATAL